MMRPQRQIIQVFMQACSTLLLK
nr:unnamed protein product [Callosobruchus analis]